MSRIIIYLVSLSYFWVFIINFFLLQTFKMSTNCIYNRKQQEASRKTLQEITVRHQLLGHQPQTQLSLQRYEVEDNHWIQCHSLSNYTKNTLFLKLKSVSNKTLATNLYISAQSTTNFTTIQMTTATYFYRNVGLLRNTPIYCNENFCIWVCYNILPQLLLLHELWWTTCHLIAWIYQPKEL